MNKLQVITDSGGSVQIVQIIRRIPGIGFKLTKDNNYDMKTLKKIIILTLRMISKLVMLMTPWLKILRVLLTKSI